MQYRNGAAQYAIFVSPLAHRDDLLYRLCHVRICIVVPDLRAGGAQRVIATLVSDFVGRGHSVTVITFDTAENDFYPLSAGVQRVVIGGLQPARSLIRALLANAHRIYRLRRAISDRRPEVVLSFMDTVNVTTIAATRRLRTAVVISERIYPPLYPLRRPWELLRRISYPLADALVVQTGRGQDWAQNVVDTERVAIIPNPLATTFLSTNPTPVSERPRAILAAGRLVHQKGFDLLIDAFAASHAPALGWTLLIHGRGSEEQNLRARIRDQGVEACVTLSGDNVPLADEFASAQIFVLSSRFEGFPNVLLEAMGCGCAVIATDCQTGPSDIVTDGVNGILVGTDSVESIRRALDRLILDDALRVRLGADATHVRETFDPGSISAQWLDVFCQSIERARAHHR